MATSPTPPAPAERLTRPDGRLAGILAITVTSILWGTTGTAATFAPDAGVVVLGAVAVALYPLAFYSSMHLAGVSIGSVVSLASAPLASGILERVVDGTPLSRWWMAAAALGVSGSTLLCLAQAGQPGGSGMRLLAGIALGLVAGATYATYSWVVHRLMGGGIPRAAAMGSVFGGGGLLLLPVLAATGAPLLATLLAVLIVGERLSGAGWAGLAVIGGALVLLACAPPSRS